MIGLTRPESAFALFQLSEETNNETIYCNGDR